MQRTASCLRGRLALPGLLSLAERYDDSSAPRHTTSATLRLQFSLTTWCGMPTEDLLLRHHKKLLLSAVIFLLYHDTLLARNKPTEDCLLRHHEKPLLSAQVFLLHHATLLARNVAFVILIYDQMWEDRLLRIKSYSIKPCSP